MLALPLPPLLPVFTCLPAGGNAGHFRHLIAFLSERYTVYAVDLLGFGESDKPPDVEYSPELWADIINGAWWEPWDSRAPGRDGQDRYRRMSPTAGNAECSSCTAAPSCGLLLPAVGGLKGFYGTP